MVWRFFGLLKKTGTAGFVFLCSDLMDFGDLPIWSTCLWKYGDRTEKLQHFKTRKNAEYEKHGSN
ncbi:hypothetical protein ASJ81_16930 [Methanosarcina spelaei]|uniref:Uncharacterized protein n=1 Tax=Methanosarcina spelaei TaxID=1036679 RepID=A0A2A2HWJ4_9EURY|nr:hypothetical protein ASJ81_16930 [Methanosarcina spelaei]